MKLLTKYNQANIIATIVIFIAGSFVFFFILRYFLFQQLDNGLQSEQQEIIQYVKKFNRFAQIIQTKDQFTTIDSTGISNHADQFYSIKKWNPIEKQEQWFREIKFTTILNGQHYQVTVSDSQIETDDLLKLIIFITVVMIALIMTIGFLVNKVIMARLWKPFYQTIDKINNYHLTSQQVLQLERSSIDEFDLLNKNISAMTERAQQEYKNLKEFTGNAAHEMQTPLAVIRTKLDLLVQNEKLLADDAQPIHDIELAVHKLSRLFNSLLLLTKIENRQYSLNESVLLNEVIENKLIELAHLAEAKNIHIIKDINPVKLIFHQQLADILIRNLLNNAMRYNFDNGSISIKLDRTAFTITNTSTLPALNAEMVFKRFYRHNDTTQEGNGLGLSIVKQICDVAGFAPHYTFADNRHIITIVL